MENKKLACIILNYNDADNTIKLVQAVKEYKMIDDIVIVDNASTDMSCIRLESYVESLENEHIHFIVSESNKGYGSGNNAGIRCAKTLGARYALVANPDTEFKEDIIKELMWGFVCYNNLAVIAPKVYADEYLGYNSLHSPFAFPIRGFYHELAELNPLTRRIFHTILHYPKERYEKRFSVVDAVPGSLLLIDIDKFLEVGGYDEEVFLYQEEHILGIKLAAKGYIHMIATKAYYIHRHSQSIDKSYRSLLAKQRLREKSCMYYFKKYLKISKPEEALAYLWFRMIEVLIILCGR